MFFNITIGRIRNWSIIIMSILQVQSEIISLCKPKYKHLARMNGCFKFKNKNTFITLKKTILGYSFPIFLYR